MLILVVVLKVVILVLTVALEILVLLSDRFMILIHVPFLMRRSQYHRDEAIMHQRMIHVWKCM